MVREEYLAVGIRVALHPQIDLATGSRWPRISGTFGEDAHVAAAGPGLHRGFPGATLGPRCVYDQAFPRRRPAENEGLDPHFEFQPRFPGHNFGYHLIPFKAALAAGTAAIMPY